uniref:NADH dehydrogenase subunit 2 n=1 Tax=Romanomermis culicivorax TaxID=13658 RepID=A0A915JSE6_ROMCU
MASSRPSWILSPLALASDLASILALILALVLLSLAPIASVKGLIIWIMKLHVGVLALALPVSSAYLGIAYQCF